MKLHYGTKSLLLVTLIAAVVLAAFAWWARRPVWFSTKDGAKYPMHGYSAVVGCVLRKDHQSLSRLLLLDRYDLNRPSSPSSGQGWTLLQHAIHLGSAECVEILLENGADPNLAYGGSPTPLELARRKQRQDIIALLKKHGD